MPSFSGRKTHPIIPDGEDFVLMGHPSDPETPFPVDEASLKGPKQPKGDGIVFHRLNDIEEEETDWLWEPYVPRGELVIMDGDPGIGKSSIGTWLAAALSTGGALPGTSVRHPPMTVALLCGEESLSKTVKKRLRMVGANGWKVFVSDHVMTLNAQGVGKIARMLEETDARLLVVDTIPFYMGAKLDINKSNEVAEVTRALLGLAKQFDCTIIMIRHLRKAETENDIYRGQGSMYWMGAVRSGLLVTKDKDGRTFMKHVKSNVGPIGDPWEYRIKKDGGFEWVGPYSPGPSAERTRGRPAEKVSRAKEIILTLTAEGPCPAVQIIATGKEEGISFPTMQNAKSLLGDQVRSRRMAGGWVWERTGGGTGKEVFGAKIGPWPPLAHHVPTEPPGLDPLLAEAMMRLGRG